MVEFIGRGKVHQLPKEAYELFEKKGRQNAVKLRRILQLTKDLTNKKMNDLRILDLGCGEGVYSIEVALTGAEVIGIDGRTERMDEGRAVAEKLGLSNVKFIQRDVRAISKEDLGVFDCIYILGLFYHLDHPETFDVLSKAYEMCTKGVIMDTHIALEEIDTVTHNGVSYSGIKVREHKKTDSKQTQISQLGASIGNVDSFWYTKESLVRLFKQAGFSSVLECHAPLEMTKEKEKGNRVTFVGIKGDPVKISSYPWINDMPEDDITAEMQKLGAWQPYWHASKEAICTMPEKRYKKTFKGKVKSAIKALFRKCGIEIRRIE